MTHQQFNYTTSPRHHLTPSVNTVERYHQRRTIKAALEEQENRRNTHFCSLPGHSSNPTYPTYSTLFQNSQESCYIDEWEQKRNDRLNLEKKRMMKNREESINRKLEKERHQKKIAMSIIKRRQAIKLREMTNLNLICAQTQQESQNHSLDLEEDLDILNLEIPPSLTFDEDDSSFQDEDDEESNELFDELEILPSKTFDEDEDKVDERDDEEGDSAEFEISVRTVMPFEEEWEDLELNTFYEDEGGNEGGDELSIAEQYVPSPLHNHESVSQEAERSSQSLVLQNSTIHNRFSTVTINRQY
jgi:hypothetical protein